MPDRPQRIDEFRCVISRAREAEDGNRPKLQPVVQSRVTAERNSERINLLAANLFRDTPECGDRGGPVGSKGRESASPAKIAKILDVHQTCWQPAKPLMNEIEGQAEGAFACTEAQQHIVAVRSPNNLNLSRRVVAKGERRRKMARH